MKMFKKLVCVMVAVACSLFAVGNADAQGRRDRGRDRVRQRDVQRVERGDRVRDVRRVDRIRRDRVRDDFRYRDRDRVRVVDRVRIVNRNYYSPYYRSQIVQRFEYVAPQRIVRIVEVPDLYGYEVDDVCLLRDHYGQIVQVRRVDVVQIRRLISRGYREVYGLRVNGRIRVRENVNYRDRVRFRLNLNY